MSEEQETEPLEIGLGSYVGLRKGATLITGMVNGIKLADGICGSTWTQAGDLCR